MSRVSYTKDYINKLTKRKLFTPGWYFTMTTDATFEVSKAGNIQIITRETPLRDPSDPKSKARTSITNYVVTPLLPEDNPEHEPPESAIGQTLQYLRAKGHQVPEFPRRQENGSFTYGGDPVGKEVSKELRMEAVGRLLEMCEDFRENSEGLEGYGCYTLLDIDGEYNKIKTMRAELPDDKELVDPENWFAKSEKTTPNGDEDEEEEDDE